MLAASRQRGNLWVVRYMHHLPAHIGIPDKISLTKNFSDRTIGKRMEALPICGELVR